VAVLGGGGQPNLAIHYDGRGPAAIRNLGLPLDVSDSLQWRGRPADGMWPSCEGPRISGQSLAAAPQTLAGNHQEQRPKKSVALDGSKHGSSLVAVVADGFNRAAFLGFLALGFFLGAAGLLENVGITAVIAAGEIGGGGFATEVAVDAWLST